MITKLIKRMQKNIYKASKPRFSHHYGCEVVDILKEKVLFGFIHYWEHHDTIINAGQVDEVVMFLNHPEVLNQRLKEAVLKLNATLKP